jgi:catechol 2,3-dioxygenase-like lactoylglutathione lyase family enzyme
MAFHHVAVATRDLAATHRFYVEAMGFTLAKVVAAKTPEGGWAKHLFYDSGGGELFAVWDLHDESLGDWSPGLSTGLGLPQWVNHIAFTARDAEHLEACKRRWLAQGSDVAEVDHGWCVSIYTRDPNGTMVEWCWSTRALDATDRAEAQRLLADPNPELETSPHVRFYAAKDSPSS